MPCKYNYMRKFIFACLALCLAVTAEAQYIPAFQKDVVTKKDPGTKYWSRGNTLRHLEISLTAGTSGVGLDLALPLSRYMQVRLGYDYMPPFQKSFSMNLAGGGTAARQYNAQGNRVRTSFDRIQQYILEHTGMEIDDHIMMTGKMKMHNAKLLMDIYPFKYDKNWHITAGVYWGPEEFAQTVSDIEAEKTIALMEYYNKEYATADAGNAIKDYGRLTLYPGDSDGKPRLAEPAVDGTVKISVKSSAVKPYLGFGYTGRLVGYRDDWKISAELGVMIWGGTPSQRLHDGTDLSKDVKDIPGTFGDYVSIVKALKVYPVLSVRFAKTIF